MSVRGATSKPTLVFIHGFLGRPADWHRVVEQLSERYQCLLLTVPDRDEQGQPLGDWQGLLRACEHHWTALLPHRFTLIGYSLGGRIALALSQTWLTRLEALVLESVHPGLSTLQPATSAASRTADGRTPCAPSRSPRHWIAGTGKGFLHASATHNGPS